MKNAKSLLFVSLLSIAGAAFAGTGCCSAENEQAACTTEACTVPSKKVVAQELDVEGCEVSELNEAELSNEGDVKE